MKRWSYLIPRLMILALAVIAFRFGLERMLQRGLVRTGEAYLGAPVEVGSVHTSLAQLTVTLNNVTAMHPTRPNENLVEWEEGVFHLDPSAALRRRFVVHDGRITGLKFNKQRTADGLSVELSGSDPLQPHVATPKAPWTALEQISASLNAPLLDELAAVTLARELGERWPGPWEALTEATNDVAQETAALKRQMDQARRYPLKGPHDWRRIAADTQRLTAEMEELTPRLEKLRQQMEADKSAVVAAWKADQQKLQQGLAVAPFDPDQLTALLMGPENAAHVQQTIACVHWLRQQATAPSYGRGFRQAGTNVKMPGSATGPEFLIESIALSGELEFAGQTVPWQGTACGISTQPQVYGRPAVLRLLAGAPCPMTLEGVLDHTKEKAQDRIAIDCPLVPMGERTLGDVQQFALTVAPTAAQLRVIIELSGDRLRGEIVCKQERTRLQVASLPQSLIGAQDLLQSAADNVKRLESRVELGGTLQRPTWKLKSDLGLQLANGFREVLQRKLDESRDVVAQDAQQQYTTEVEQLDRWLQEQQSSVATLLDTCTTALQELQTQVALRQGRDSGAKSEPLQR